MTKAELVQQLVEDTNLPKRDVEYFLASFIRTVKLKVYDKGETVSLPGLGIFKQKKAPARTGRNPQTGAVISIPAKTKLTFKASSTL